MVAPSFQNINLGNFSNPRVTFADVDTDGDADLLVAIDDGEIMLYRNDGPVGNPVFTAVSGFFSFIDAVRAPSVAGVDIDNDGDDDFFVGGERGGLDFYRNSLLTSIGGNTDPHLPRTSRLFQNFPNPFNPTTTISFIVGERDRVTITVIDLLGREVATVVDRDMPAGSYSMGFDGSALAGGVYFCRL
jgi:hypothetical protein